MMAETLLDWLINVLTRYEIYCQTKICVITLVGKAPLTESNLKGSLINDLLDRQVFRFTTISSSEVAKNSKIEAYFDPDNQCVFLNLITHHDQNVYDTISNNKDWSQNCIEREEEYLRSLLFLFSISQLIIIVHPSCRFDLSYLHLFRKLNDLRERMLCELSDVLTRINGLSEAWTHEGRPCCPRLLFLFHHPPSFMKADGTVETKRGSYKKLAACLEDQIYKLLRRSRVITNNTSNCGCALPQKQSFCYIFGPNEEPTRCSVYEMLDSMTKTVANSEEKKRDFDDRSAGFKHFFFAHLDEAFSPCGFDDNVGKMIGPAHFELPSLETFVNCASVLHNYFVADKTACTVLLKIQQQIDTATLFSENRCRKVYPIALSHYQDGLPAYYSLLQHNAQLLQAVHILQQQARGPCLKRTIEKLARECEEFWLNGRKSCESYSLTGNMCINQLHRGPGDITVPENAELPVLTHTSGTRFLSTCECGRRQAWRDDPFDIFEANYAFFARHRTSQNGEFVCCQRLQRLEPPVYKRMRRTPTEQLFESTTPTHQMVRKISIEQLFEGFKLADGVATQEDMHPDQSTTNPGADDILLDRDNMPASPHETHSSETRETNVAKQTVLNEPRAHTQDNAPGDNNQSLSQPRFNNTTSIENLAVHSCGGTGSGVSDRADKKFESKEEVDDEGKYISDHSENENMPLENSGDGAGPDYDTAPEDNEALSLSLEECLPTAESDEEKWHTFPVEEKQLRETIKTADDHISSDEYYESLLDSEEESKKYLPGMIHNQCPAGLLPLFPSWSLVCVGHSSIYAHLTGLRDNPNFSHGSQFLLPYDMTLESIDLEKWYDLMEMMANTSKRAVPYKRPRLPVDSKNGSVYVKLFIGYEYECPRGHRFMMQAPDKILKHASSSGGPRDSARSIVTNDMPLWFPCSCKLPPHGSSSRTAVSYGQLLRVHVITPKAPVLVSLNMRVQPSPNGAVFHAGFCTVPQLGPAQYWLLRLPFVYVGPTGQPAYAPQGERPQWLGRVLKHAVTVSPDF